MSDHGKQSWEERMERWASRTPDRKPAISPERARKIQERARKFLWVLKVSSYVIAFFPLLAAWLQYRNPTALIEAEGKVTGSGIPAGTTVERIYVALDDPSMEQRLAMASPWLILTLLMIGIVWALQFIEKRAKRREGNPYPATGTLAIAAVEVSVAFGVWLVMFAGVLSRGAVGEASFTDAEAVFMALFVLTVGFMCVTTMTLQIRGSEEHKKLEDIV